MITKFWETIWFGVLAQSNYNLWVKIQCLNELEIKFLTLMELEPWHSGGNLEYRILLGVRGFKSHPDPGSRF